MQETIKEGNILISEFLGCSRVVDKETNLITYWGLDLFEHESGEMLKYHLSWDWIMPVVEKIKDEYEIEIIVAYGASSCKIKKMITETKWFEISKARTSGRVSL